jgi:hypothetical protein
MGFFSRLFESSTFFESEYTVKTIMPLAQVISAHVNWKVRLSRLIEGTLGYKLDPEMLLQANDTELGRWILQADAMGLSENNKITLKQLHQANLDMHQVASRIAMMVQEGKRENLEVENEKFKDISKTLMYLLLDLSKDIEKKIATQSAA